MDKADKNMVRVWVVTAERAARDLFDLLEVPTVRLDKELTRTIRNIASDLDFAVKDIDDTLSRL